MHSHESFTCRQLTHNRSMKIVRTPTNFVMFRSSRRSLSVTAPRKSDVFQSAGYKLRVSFCQKAYLGVRMGIPGVACTTVFEFGPPCVAVP